MLREIVIFFCVLFLLSILMSLPAIFGVADSEIMASVSEVAGSAA